MPRTIPPRKDKNRVPRAKRALPAAPKKDAERVAKVIARAGLGSRREVEEWIADGRVAVNGAVLDSPAVTVTAADVITVDGAPLPERERTRLFLYHKPRGVVTTNKDPEGRTTLFEILPKGLPRLVSVGRLDLNSEGLLLLTNDGGLARVLELPETGWLRRYRVRANGAIDQAKLDTLMRGITVDGVEYGPVEAVLDRVQGANAWITVALREGKNREVRNVLGALGLKVGRLIRVSYGPFQLGELAEGAVEEVKTRILRDQIGAELAAAASADFSGPLLEHEIEEVPARPAPRAAARKAEAAAPLAARASKGRPAPTGRARDVEVPEDEIDVAPALRGRRRRLSETHDLENRGTVSDRKGRTVKVERAITPAHSERPAKGRPDAKRAEGRSGRPPARGERSGYDESGRGARAERPFREGAPSRRPTRAGEGSFEDRRPSRGFTKDRPSRSEDGDRPERPYRGRSDAPRRGSAGADDAGFESRRPARGFAKDRPSRGEEGSRPERPFRARTDAPRRGHDRPVGSDETGFEGRRPSRGFAKDRPFRADEGPRQERRSPRGPKGGEDRPSRAGMGRGAPSGARRFAEDGDRGRPEGGSRPPRGGFSGRSEGPRQGSREGSRGADLPFEGGAGRGGKPAGPGRKGAPTGATRERPSGGKGFAKGPGGPKGAPKGAPKGPSRGPGGRGRPGPKR